MSSHYQKAYFLLSVTNPKQLPPDRGIEIAIVGRSNTGKSSVINRITQNKKLARVSKTPGRTQFINMFALDETRRLADLPGYGYAKVPSKVKEKWQKTVAIYFQTRQSLKGLILVMDIRHPMRELDWDLLSYCQHYQLPVHIILNKADKLKKGAIAKIVQEVNKALTPYRNSVTFQCFSALKGIGLDELYVLLDKWYDYK